MSAQGEPDARKTKAEWLEEVKADPCNTIFGLPLAYIQRMICDYQERGVDPYRVHQQLKEAESKLAAAEARLAALGKDKK